VPRPNDLARLVRYGRGHGRQVGAAAAFSVLNKIFDIAPPLLIGLAVDTVVVREGSWIADVFGVVDVTGQLWVIAGLTLIVWVLESVFEYGLAVLWRNLAQSLEHELRVDAYRHVQGLGLDYFEDRSTGGLLAVLNDDVNQLERFLDRGANEIIQVITTVVVIGGIFFVVAPQVAWLAFLPMPAVLWGSLLFQRRIAPRYAVVRDRVGLLNGDLANNLSGIATIKSFTAEDREVDRIARDSEGYREANRRAIRLSSAFTPLIRMAILAGFLATLTYGGYLVVDGALAVGTYSVLVFISQRLLWPLTRLGETVDLYQRAMASTHRIFDLLDTEPTVVGGPVSPAASDVSGRVEFRSVRFAYPSGPEVLHGLSIELQPGETVALVGATGAGKTTVVKLLLRFYDATDGAVLLDGHDVRDLSFMSLRGAIGLVSQDVFLFHGTVRENIAYGRADATDDDVIAAAAVAEAHDFVMRLPHGYDTIVGERGQKLSGGQRQRLSIARAIVKDPPILIFDEATSSVDNETEAAIQRSLERVTRDRTTLVIAHRLSTIRHADRIYVLDHGRVVEEGHHDDLVVADGVYAALWKVQTGVAVPWHVP
jgi:ATP-binding cassette subfamily B protein